MVDGLGPDDHFGKVDQNGPWSFLRDQGGSTLLVAGVTPGTSPQYSYEPFGETTIESGPGGTEFQFAGRENDGTSLYYHRQRYYSPTRHRFISEDAIEFGDLHYNRYVYANNCPLSVMDPFGLNPCKNGFWDAFNNNLQNSHDQFYRRPFANLAGATKLGFTWATGAHNIMGRVGGTLPGGPINLGRYWMMGLPAGAIAGCR